MTSERSARRAADERLLGLEDLGEPGRTSFVVAPHLARHDRRLYGGAAIAATLAVVERATDRDAVWATTQFASTAMLGARVECTAEVLATGRRTSQVRVTATSDGDIVFVGLGAAAELKPAGLAGAVETMPQVSPPGDSTPTFDGGRRGDVGWHNAVDLRLAEQAADPVAGQLCLWARMRDAGPTTPARLAFVADMVPVAVARACGVTGAGTSLDNTLRIGDLVDTEWVLLDLRPHLAHGGYGHGSVHLWAEDGTFLATGSQTASMIVFEHDPLAGLPPG